MDATISFSRLSAGDAEILFAGLEAIRAETCRFFRRQVNYEVLSKLVKNDLSEPQFGSAAWIKGFFDYYEEEYGVKSLYDYYHLMRSKTDRDYANQFPRHQGGQENLQLYRNEIWEKSQRETFDDIRTDVCNEIRYALKIIDNHPIMFSQDMFEVFGSLKRLEFGQYVKCVANVLQVYFRRARYDQYALPAPCRKYVNRVRNQMTIDNDEILTSHTLRVRIFTAMKFISYLPMLFSYEVFKYLVGRNKIFYCDYASCVAKILAAELKGRCYMWQPYPNCEEVEKLRNHMIDISGDPTHVQPVKFLVSDIKLIGREVSFETLVSSDCYMYIGRRFTTLCGRKLKTRELYWYVRSIAMVFNEMDAKEAYVLRNTELSEFKRFILQKQQMVRLVRTFGPDFDRYCPRDWHRYGKALEDDSERESLIAIFHGISESQSAGQDVKLRSPQTIIASLQYLKLVRRTKSAEQWAQTFFETFFMYYQFKLKDMLDYFYACKEQVDNVRTYAISVLSTESL